MTEINKEVLAPPTEIREDLITTAIKFLQNEKVRQSPVGQKKAFLQRKGLTAEEIELAVNRSGVKDVSPVSSAGSQSTLVQSPGTSPPPLPVQRHLEVSRWTKAREIVAVVSMVTGFSYAAYRLFKEVIQPWLMGSNSADRRLEILERMIVKSSVKLTAIEDGLSKQQEKLQILSHDVNNKMGGSVDGSSSRSVPGITEIKSELSSIKGLLLNRRNFAPTPTQMTPSLPAWQLAGGQGDANSNKKGSSSGPDDSGEGNTNQRGSSTEQDDSSSAPEITLSSSPSAGPTVPLDLDSSDATDTSSVISAIENIEHTTDKTSDKSETGVSGTNNSILTKGEDGDDSESEAENVVAQGVHGGRESSVDAEVPEVAVSDRVMGGAGDATDTNVTLATSNANGASNLEEESDQSLD